MKGYKLLLVVIIYGDLFEIKNISRKIFYTILSMP